MVQLATPLTCLVMVTLAVAKPQRSLVNPEPSTSSGSTRCREECTKIYMPVCASNGRTYNNKCILEVESCKDRRAGGPGFALVAEGACERDKNCQKDCGETYQPVCGTNGVTYDNKCELSIASCIDSTIGQRSEGICASNGSTRCREDCTKIYMPVCASNGRTYNNKCILEVESCKDRRAGGTGFALVAEGACERDKNCQKDCGETYQPVCGTNGVTYDNKCELSIASCVDSTIGQRSEGICATDCSIACYQDREPVCGTNSVTYQNDCFLAVARCKNSSIRRLASGVCKV